MSLVPRFRPDYGPEELLAALTPSRGAVARYEQAFAGKFGCSHGVMFSYGRTALYALLKVWGLKNAEVICPAYTCVVVPHAIVLSGNVPVFVDCASGSFNMDLNGIREVITERTRVVIATHLFGYPMDVDALELLVDEAEKRFGHKIYVIQDAAHSYGAKWNGELVTSRGDAAIFGCNISKIINSIFGGMVTTRDETTCNMLREFRSRFCHDGGAAKSIRRLFYFLASYAAFNPYLYGIVNMLADSGALNRFVKYYDDAVIDFPLDWDLMPAEIEARVGMAQLQKYDCIVTNRKTTAISYLDEIKQIDGMSVREFDEGATYSHFVALVEDRDSWLKSYKQKKIQLGTIIDYLIPEMKAYMSYSKGRTFPNAARYARSAINLPIHTKVKLHSIFSSTRQSG